MRRARRNHHEAQNHERWLVSYADFITLLFAFFVVMYAVSSVNEGKYRVLSEVMTDAFRTSPRSMEPIQVGDPIRSPLREPIERLERTAAALAMPDLRPMPIPLIRPNPRPILDRPEPASEAPEAEENEQVAATEPSGTADPTDDPPVEGLETEADPLAQVMRQLQQAMGDLIDSNQVAVTRTRHWLELEIRDNILFASGSADIGARAADLLGDVAGVLRQVPNRVQVEGFTDDVPIRNAVYPSNWELSAARAASVVNVLARRGVRPERLAAIGYGEFRPVADNSTPEGRRRNRRVVLVVLGEEALRRQYPSPEPEVSGPGLAANP